VVRAGNFRNSLANAWRVVSFHAIAEEDESNLIVSPFGRRTHIRKAGEVLNPERRIPTLQNVSKGRRQLRGMREILLRLCEFLFLILEISSQEMNDPRVII
jgi:hypothetical protein